jgi:hypothetical protein
MEKGVQVAVLVEKLRMTTGDNYWMLVVRKLSSEKLVIPIPYQAVQPPVPFC